MVPYFSLLVKLAIVNRWKILFSAGGPILALFLISPMILNGLNKSEIPIGWVDEDHSRYSNQVRERIAGQERLKIQDMTRTEATIAIQKGDLEGAFVINRNFQEHIQQGNLTETIEWIRSEKSVFDTFIKEQLASEVMRLAVNSKAATTIQLMKQENDSSRWQTYYEHADSYWEPEPLFQMEFQTYQVENKQPEKATPLSIIGLAGIGFTYVWMMAALTLLPVYPMRKNQMISRLEMMSGNIFNFYGALLICVTLLAVLFWGIWLLVLDFFFDHIDMNVLQQGLAAIIPLLTAVYVTFAGLFMFQKRNGFVLFVLTISLVSFSLSSLYLVSGGEGFWYRLLPHTWLYEMMFQ